jgi:hypothetical protein
MAIRRSLPQYRIHCSLHSGQSLITVGGIRRYSNRSDLLEQLLTTSAILYQSSVTGKAGSLGRSERSGGSRSRRLRDRFSEEDLQAMVNHYKAGATAGEVAERYVKESAIRKIECACAAQARTIKRFLPMTHNTLDHGLSNALSEATNAHIQLLTRRAYGYHSPEALIAMANLTRCGLCPPLHG